ncbi:hypothetical protein LCGC14_3107520, partial [marine sediment metagenome]
KTELREQLATPEGQVQRLEQIREQTKSGNLSVEDSIEVDNLIDETIAKIESGEDVTQPQEGKVDTLERAEKTFKKAGDVVDGRKVRSEVPNTSSIEATFGNDFTKLSGIREVPLSQFDAPPDITSKTKALAEQIKQSGEINPLIVAIDKDGPYILEGANRFDAMKILGAKSIPAIVVTDDASLEKATQPPTVTPKEVQAPPEVEIEVPTIPELK